MRTCEMPVYARAPLTWAVTRTESSQAMIAAGNATTAHMFVSVHTPAATRKTLRRTRQPAGAVKTCRARLPRSLRYWRLPMTKPPATAADAMA